MSGGSARTIRRYSVELWQDLVLHGIRKSTFQHLTINWNFSVLEMALKTLHFVQGPSRTPVLFIPRYLTNIFSGNILQIEESSNNRKYGNLKNRSWKVKVSSFVSAGTVCIHRRLGGDSDREIVSFRSCVRAVWLPGGFRSQIVYPPFPFSLWPRRVFPFPLCGRACSLSPCEIEVRSK